MPTDLDTSLRVIANQTCTDPPWNLSRQPLEYVCGLSQVQCLGVFSFCFDFPRIALYHSCFAILIVASPGAIISVIPAGIFLDT